jgi:hypothetical protein
MTVSLSAFCKVFIAVQLASISSSLGIHSTKTEQREIVVTDQHACLAMKLIGYTARPQFKNQLPLYGRNANNSQHAQKYSIVCF